MHCGLVGIDKCAGWDNIDPPHPRDAGISEYHLPSNTSGEESISGVRLCRVSKPGRPVIASGKFNVGAGLAFVASFRSVIGRPLPLNSLAACAFLKRLQKHRVRRGFRSMEETRYRCTVSRSKGGANKI